MALKSESALKRAIEMEMEEKQFYLQSAEKVKSKLAKNVFKELAKEEDFHIKTIKTIYGNLKKDKPFKEWVTTIGSSGKLGKVFNGSLAEKAKASEDDLKALRFALDLEDKSTKYYEGLAGETKNAFERRFYLTLSYEEKGHYLKIMDSIEYLTDPVGWLYVKQGSMVDGG